MNILKYISHTKAILQQHLKYISNPIKISY